MTDRQFGSGLLPSPAEPQSIALRRAYQVLLSTHATSQSFLDTFDFLSFTDMKNEAEQQGRAMLVFASAGLDSMVKHVVEDALPLAITLNPELHEGLRVFVERRLKRDEQIDHHFLSNVLVADNPMERMLTELVNNLTSDSMQSVEQLSRVCSYFAVSTDELASSVDGLRRIFQMRNEIVHEMDIDMTVGTGEFRPRRRDDMVDATNELLGVAAALLTAVDAKLS